MEKKLKLYIPILIVTLLVFIIAYHFYTGEYKISSVSNNSINNNIIYYCEDSSYALNNNTCSKYILQPAYLLGDVNSDKIVDINDINIINDYINNKKDLNNFEIAAADINSDSNVDIDDISIIQNYLQESDNSVGINLVCSTEYTKEDDVCIKKIVVEANKMKYTFGDINKDSKCDMNDKLLLTNYLSKEIYLDEVSYKIADTNEDSVVDKKDLSFYTGKLKTNTNKLYTKTNYAKVDDSKINLLVRNDSANLKNNLEINSVINYYVINADNNDYYFEFINYNNDMEVEKSMCNILKKDIEYNFKIKITNKNNYGEIKIYSDSSCESEVGRYMTDKFQIN